MSNDKIEIMEPGELEHRKVFEEVTTQNVKTVIDYSTQTRDIVRDLETEVKRLTNMLVTREAEMSEFRRQISTIQAQLYVN